jgi:hypothetical protein
VKKLTAFAGHSTIYRDKNPEALPSPERQRGGGKSMAKRYIYEWGTERPSARKTRFNRRKDRLEGEIKAEEKAYAARLEAERLAHEARIALIRAKQQGFIDACDRIDRYLDDRGVYKFDHLETGLAEALPVAVVDNIDLA